MEPALLDRPPDDGAWVSADDVGSFDQGSGFSRWALARYLVGRPVHPHCHARGLSAVDGHEAPVAASDPAQ